MNIAFTDKGNYAAKWTQTLPKAQQIKGIEYFDSFDNFCSEQKLE